MLTRTLVVFVLLAGTWASEARASIIWDWSFASEAGQFVTDGTVPLPGTYTLTDFIVTSSATGGTIGSLGNGDYVTGPTAYVTDEPFSFSWDGSAVTGWFHSGINTYDWWAFRDVAAVNRFYFFAWDTGNINDASRAAHFDSGLGDLSPLAVGDITVQAAAPAVPEPGTLLLLGAALGAVAARRRLQKRT